jgi:iron(III) transport system substrate-binding protein
MVTKHLAVTLILAGVLLVLTATISEQAHADEFVVYSARNEQLIKPLFDAYTAATGTTIRFITDKEGPLLARLKAEGANTVADMLITVDAGNLWQAARDGVLAKVDSKILKANIPAHLRDPDDRWFGVVDPRAHAGVQHETRASRAAVQL